MGRKKEGRKYLSSLCSFLCKVRLFPPLSLNRRKLVPPRHLVVMTVCLQCRDAGLIPGWETKIPRASGQGQKKKKKETEAEWVVVPCFRPHGQWEVGLPFRSQLQSKSTSSWWIRLGVTWCFSMLVVVQLSHCWFFHLILLSILFFFSYFLFLFFVWHRRTW